MKTAMTELIELLELNTTNEPLPNLIDVIKEVYIQKEKEQIKNDFTNGQLFPSLKFEEYYTNEY